MKRLYIPCVLLILLCVGSVSSLTLYVNKSHSSCNDAVARAVASNPATPWCTVAGLLNNITAGDVGYIANGFYNSSAGADYTMSTKTFTSPTTIMGQSRDGVILSKAYVAVTWVNSTNSTHGLWNTSSIVTSATYVGCYKNNTNEPLMMYDAYANLTVLSLPDGTYWDNTNDKLYVAYRNLSQNPTNVPLSCFKGSSAVLALNSVVNLTVTTLTIQDGEKCIYTSSASTDIIINDTQIKCAFSNTGAIDIRGYRTNVTNNYIWTTRPKSWWWDSLKYSLYQEVAGVWAQDSGGAVNLLNNNISGYFNGIALYSTAVGKHSGSVIMYNTFTDIMDDALELEYYDNGYTVSYNNISDSYVGLSLSTGNSTQARSTFSYNIVDANKVINYSNNTGSTSIGEAFKFFSDKSVTEWTFDHNTIKSNKGIYGSSYSNTQINTSWTNNIFWSDSGRLIDRSGLVSDGVIYDYNIYRRTDSGNLFRYYNSDASASEVTSIGTVSSWDSHSRLSTTLDFLGYYPVNDAYVCCMGNGSVRYVGAVACTCTIEASSPIVVGGAVVPVVVNQPTQVEVDFDLMKEVKIPSFRLPFYVDTLPLSLVFVGVENVVVGIRLWALIVITALLFYFVLIRRY